MCGTKGIVFGSSRRSPVDNPKVLLFSLYFINVILKGESKLL